MEQFAHLLIMRYKVDPNLTIEITCHESFFCNGDRNYFDFGNQLE
jgi:hypothetical protein